MLITPNFQFDGHCEEAIKLYQKAFCARLGCLLRYSDALTADYDRELTDAQRRCVYQAEIFIGGQRIMMSDNLDVPMTRSVALSLVVTMDTREEVLRAFEAMKECAEIIYPPHRTSYASCAVSLIDRFGFRWNIMTEQTER